MKYLTSALLILGTIAVSPSIASQNPKGDKSTKAPKNKKDDKSTKAPKNKKAQKENKKNGAKCPKRNKKSAIGPKSAPTKDTFDTLSIERNLASAAQINSRGLLQPLLNARVFVQGGGLFFGGAAAMFSPLGKTFIRPYDGCRNEAFGLNDGNYTEIVCDGYDRNMEVCELEPTCIADDFMKIEYRASKGEYLSNTDDVLKLTCYESEEFSSLMSSFGLTCDDAPIIPKKDIVAAFTRILELQGAVGLTPDGFSNELLSFGKDYYTAADLGGDNNTTRAISIGDSNFAYYEAINAPKGFSTELVLKNEIISDYADYHVIAIEDIDPSAIGFDFLNHVMEAYFSQKYSCRTYSDKDREQLSDFMQFYYENECERNLGTMLAVKYDDATAAFAALQNLRTRSDDCLEPCNDCSCISDDVLLSDTDTANTDLKSGKSARNVNGCAD